MSKCMRGGVVYKHHQYKTKYGETKCEACGQVKMSTCEQEFLKAISAETEHCPRNDPSGLTGLKTEQEVWDAAQWEQVGKTVCETIQTELNKNAIPQTTTSRICPNCGILDDHGHYAPPSFGEPGFFTCEPRNE
jgi:hypothetical protein